LKEITNYFFTLQLATDYSDGQLPAFPPKKMNMSFFSLGDEDLEERRQSLEAYMQKGMSFDFLFESLAF
jgi:hypothetical protein